MDPLATDFDTSATPFSCDDELLDTVSTWARAAMGARVDPARDATLPHWIERLATCVDTPHASPLRAVTLQRRLALTRDDLVLLVALAAMVDDDAFTALRRHYVNADAQVTVGLAVALLSSTRRERRRFLARLDAAAPLRRMGLVHVRGDQDGALGGRFVDVDEMVLAWLDRRDHWPDALTGHAAWVGPRPGPSPVAAAIDRAIGWSSGHSASSAPPTSEPASAAIADPALHAHPPVPRAPASALHRDPVAIGPRTDGSVAAPLQPPEPPRRASESLPPGLPAQTVGQAVDSAARAQVHAGTSGCDPSRTIFVALGGPAPSATLDAAATWTTAPLLHVWNPAVVGLAGTLARLHAAPIYVECGRDWATHAPTLRAVRGVTALLDCDPPGHDALRAELAPLFEVRLPPMSLVDQVETWRAALVDAGLAPLDEATLRTRVCDMALGASDIRHTARRAAWQSYLDGAEVGPEVLRTMATSNLNQGMYAVADRVPTTLGWNDVVLPCAVLEKLMEIITYARYHAQVFDTWGFGAKVPYGRANTSLFYGPPGTGKTMMAGIIARELGLDLFRVDMSRVVSKYIGETEKNLARVFDEAERSYAVLLFDEADSLFARRTEVKSSHDRYANLEVNYLLQRIETFDGITILTTNYRDNIDPAFARRLRFKVEFPQPEGPDRAMLWQRMLPRAAHVADSIDFDALGHEFELNGAHIKDAVLRAAFAAAESGACIDTATLQDAAVATSREQGHLVKVRLAS